MHDVIIKNGTLIDGSGSPMYAADLAVSNKVITKIGDLSKDKAQKIIDATNQYVTPGFIDISNRSDVYWRLFQDPGLESLLWQGITTIIGGNSGASLAPIYNQQMLFSTRKWTDITGINVDWTSVEDFLTKVQETQISTHFGTFIGHGTLRRGIIGDEMRELTDSELQMLLKQIKDALNGGALGVSLGLLYTHEQSATRTELLAIAKEVHKGNALLVAHLRDEDQDLVSAVAEILDIVSQTGVRSHITHLKAVGQPYWPLMQEALERIDAMILDGFDVTFDVYPYTTTGSVLYTFLPSWVAEGGKKMLLGRLKNKATYDQVRKELKESKLDLSNAIVSLAPHSEKLHGRTLKEIASDRDVDIESLVLDLLLASEGRVIILFDALSEENIERALKSPYSIVTSNSPGYSISDDVQKLRIHPRSFGAFPRLFDRYVRERSVLNWELAVHKSTFKVAQRLNITGKGLLREGFSADIVVIDPKLYKDQATLEQPVVYATGVKHLLIGGVLAISEGSITNLQAGSIVKR